MIKIKIVQVLKSDVNNIENIIKFIIDIKLPKQKSINFPRGIFYKPESKISLKEDLIFQSNKKNKIDKNFKININQNSYTKIFNRFKKKIRSGETYQIKICTKYKNKSKIDPLDFFCRLAKSNLAPEAFMIKDRDYSIISCSPENLIDKKGYFEDRRPASNCDPYLVSDRMLSTVYSEVNV